MPQVVRMLVGEHVLPAEGRVYAGTPRLRKGDQRLSGALRPAARDHDGTPSGGEPAGDGPTSSGARRRAGRGRHVGLWVIVDRLTEHVRRQREHDGARTARSGDPQSSGDELGEAVGAVNCCGPLRDRGVEGAEIHLLKGFSPEEVRLDLPEQNEHRRRVLPRRVYPDGEVGCAHAPRGHRHRRSPRQLAFRLGHKGGAGLVARRDEGEVGVLLGGVQDLQKALAGHGVQAPHTGPRHNLGRDVPGRFLGAIRHCPVLRTIAAHRDHIPDNPYILHPRPQRRSRKDPPGHIVCRTRRGENSGWRGCSGCGMRCDRADGGDLPAGGRPGRRDRGCRVAARHDVQCGRLLSGTRTKPTPKTVCSPGAAGPSRSSRSSPVLPRAASSCARAWRSGANGSPIPGGPAPYPMSVDAMRTNYHPATWMATLSSRP